MPLSLSSCPSPEVYSAWSRLPDNDAHNETWPRPLCIQQDTTLTLVCMVVSIIGEKIEKWMTSGHVCVCHSLEFEDHVFRGLARECNPKKKVFKRGVRPQMESRGLVLRANILRPSKGRKKVHWCCLLASLHCNWTHWCSRCVSVTPQNTNTFCMLESVNDKYLIRSSSEWQKIIFYVAWMDNQRTYT